MSRIAAERSINSTSNSDSSDSSFMVVKKAVHAVTLILANALTMRAEVSDGNFESAVTSIK